MPFLIFKYLHILAAIVAVGFNVSYAVWIIRARRDPAHTAFALKGIKFLDDRIANPAYVALVITGVFMWFLAPYPITTLWIIAALILYLVMVFLAAGLYTPTLRNQIELVEAGDTTSAAFMSLARRGQIVGQVLAVIVLAILALMVFKPHL